jgi:cytochrome b6-f complex iron-sulfur subunit
MMSSSRREFLTQTGTLSAAIACGGGMGLLPGCSGFRYAVYSVQGSSLAVNKAEFEKDRFVLVEYPSLPTPIYISKTSEDNYSAFLLVCSHKQCEVKPAPDVLICPCHGSRYSNTGQVVKGPAEQALTSFPVTTDGHKIYIKLDQKRTTR